MSVIMECDNILAKLNATNIQKSKDLVIEFTLFLGYIRGKGRNAHRLKMMTACVTYLFDLFVLFHYFFLHLL